MKLSNLVKAVPAKWLLGGILASLLLGGVATAQAAGLTPAQATAVKYAEASAATTVDVAKSLWDYSEVGLAEYKSFVKVTDTLKQAGFQVTPAIGGIPTALMATWGSGKPVLGIYEDFDALTGVGHGCGHNLNTGAGVGAAIALKNALTELGLPGTIKLFIHPAEEIWDAAPIIAGAGVYNDLDVMLSAHAAAENGSEYGSTLAMDHVEYKFKGKPSHSSAAPDKGRSALDAVEIMDVAVNFLREHLIQEMRIHYVITDGGAMPNIVPETAASRYYIRGPKYPNVLDAREKIDNCAKAAALATGTTLEIGFSSGIYNKVPNKTLALLGTDLLKTIPAPSFSAEDQKQMEAVGIKGVPAFETKEPNGSQSFGSNPIGDVTWKVPTASLNYASWVPGTAGHSVDSAKQSGTVYGLTGAVYASKLLSALGMQMLTDAEALGKVRAEFAERQKGMPPYESKAMIPEVAYPEAPGVTVVSPGTVKFAAVQTAFVEKAGDKIELLTMSGEKLGEYVVPATPAGEYSFSLAQGVKPAQRLKLNYVSSDGSFAWFYGYVHAK